MLIWQSGIGNDGRTEEENEKKKEEVLKLAQEGKMHTKISIEAGVGHDTVKRWTENTNTVLVTMESKDILRQGVIELAKAEKTVREIHEKTGVCESTIRVWCKKAGITLKKGPIVHKKKIKVNSGGATEKVTQKKIGKADLKTGLIFELRELGYDTGFKLSLQEIKKLAKEIGVKYGYWDPRNLAIDVFSVHHTSWAQLVTGASKQVTITLNRRNERKELIAKFKEKVKEKSNWTSSEIDSFCKENDVDIEFFISDFMEQGYSKIVIERYKKAIESNPNGIYIGPRTRLSSCFIKKHKDELAEMCKNVSKMISAQFKENNNGQYITEAWEYVVENSGGIERNFDYDGSDFPIISMMQGSAYGHIARIKIAENAKAKKNVSHVEFTYKDEEKEVEIVIPDNTYNPEDILLQEKNEDTEVTMDKIVGRAMSGDEVDDKVLQILYECTKNGASSRDGLIKLIAEQIDIDPEQVLGSIGRIGDIFKKRGLVTENEKGKYALAK
ncbi:MAG: helix-turn-helix domain containing protein [Lachnospiraceae bacterium]|jgi:uncharacterized protein YerC|nr:helix-turn-helix domain containing protein [Lachnospiraceae bacterium]